MLLIPSAPLFLCTVRLYWGLTNGQFCSPHPPRVKVQPLGKIFESRQKDFLRQIILYITMYTEPPVIHPYTQTLCTNANVSSFATITYNFYRNLNIWHCMSICIAFLHYAIMFLHNVISKRQGFIACSSIKLSYIYQLLFWVCPTFWMPPAPGLYNMAPKLLLRIF
jgi:hypothetical protein